MLFCLLEKIGVRCPLFGRSFEYSEIFNIKIIAKPRKDEISKIVYSFGIFPENALGSLIMGSILYCNFLDRKVLFLFAIFIIKFNVSL